MSHKRKTIKQATAKLLLAGVLSFGAIIITAPAMAQVPTPPQGPPGGAPTPPPSPGEMLDKINIFKKKKTTKSEHKLDTKVEAPATAPGAPPNPPNPLDLFKKKKKRSSILPPPPKGPGA